MILGEQFKKLRIEKGLTQQELADDFNKIYGHTFSKSSISQYENGKRTPETRALKDFASYFDVSIDYLLGISENRNNTIIPIKDNSYENILEDTNSFFMDSNKSRYDKDILFKQISAFYFESLNIKNETNLYKDHLEISRLVGKIYENAHSISSNLNFNLDFEIKTTSLDLFSETYKIDTMATCFMESLKWELNEIKDIYCYAISSNIISKSLKPGPVKNHIIYCQRNLHFRNFFHRWFSMLEHIAFMINNFSKLELLSEDKKVSIFEIRKKMKSIRIRDIGYISFKDFESLLEIISEDKIYKNIDAKNMKEFRNILVHRFHIDPDLKVLVSFNKDNDNLNFKYYRTFEFDEYIKYAFNILNNLYDILNDLSKLDLMKNVITIKSNK